jgi:hypothetical protein
MIWELPQRVVKESHPMSQTKITSLCTSILTPEYTQYMTAMVNLSFSLILQGPFGNEVSHYVCMSLAKRILEDPVSLIDPEGAIKEAFEKTDALLKKYVSKEVTYNLFKFNFRKQPSLTVI